MLLYTGLVETNSTLFSRYALLEKVSLQKHPTRSPLKLAEAECHNVKNDSA